MTMHYTKRCGHCGSHYPHYTSGHQCHTDPSSETHCGDCNTIMKAALKDVPVKFKREFLRATDVTIEQIKEWARIAREKNPTGPRRVIMNLTDLDDPDNRNITGCVWGGEGFEGRYFFYSYWSKGETATRPTKIEEELEVEVATGTVTGNWKWY